MCLLDTNFLLFILGEVRRNAFVVFLLVSMLILSVLLLIIMRKQEKDYKAIRKLEQENRQLKQDLMILAGR
jgi:preprotein translocase subunit YajC